MKQPNPDDYEDFCEDVIRIENIIIEAVKPEKASKAGLVRLITAFHSLGVKFAFLADLTEAEFDEFLKYEKKLFVEITKEVGHLRDK
jgi:hypothetical protein